MTTNEVPRVNGACRRDLINQSVHDGLGHRRVVAFVVAATAVADHVDDDVLVERIAVLEGECCHVDNSFRIVAVHMENRYLEALGEVGGVAGRTARRWSGCEANLVVYDHVDRATGLVTGQLAHIEGFLDNALANERGVAVNQNGDNWQAFIAKHFLLGADNAF